MNIMETILFYSIIAIMSLFGLMALVVALYSTTKK